MKTDSKEASYEASYEAPLTRKIGLKTKTMTMTGKTRYKVGLLSPIFLVSGASYEASYEALYGASFLSVVNN